jgi:sensor domain CHASE-containing protein
MQNVAFEAIIFKRKSYWRNLLIVLLIAIIISGLWYYMDKMQFSVQSKPSLIENDTYVQEKVDTYLENNPSAEEEYARDVQYLNIAREEKNPAICDKINDSEIRYFCTNAAQ